MNQPTRTARSITLNAAAVAPATKKRRARRPLDLLGRTGGLFKRFWLWRHSRSLLQIVLLIVAIAMIFDGLTGDQISFKNLATSIAWIDYRAMLGIFLLVVGGVFCMSCPFVWVSRRVQKAVGLNRAWPSWLKGKWLALGLLLLIFWGYEQFGLWSNPALTAVVILLYFAGAVAVDFVFKGSMFCKYVCPLGLFTQVYAMANPTEVRAKNFDVCKSCTTKDCLRGNTARKVDGCQTNLYLGAKQSNMDCTYCLDCVRSCPHDNVSLITRAPAAETWLNMSKRDLSVAAVAWVVTFTALTNAAGMIGDFQNFIYSTERTTGLPQAVVYGVAFVVATVLVPALFAVAASWVAKGMAFDNLRAKSGTSLPVLGKATATSGRSATHALVPNKSPDLLKLDGAGIFKRFGLAILPLGLSIWVAHYLFHFLTGGGGLWPATQNFFARLGIPILGEPRWVSQPLLDYSLILPIQLAVVYIGFMVTVVANYKIARGLFKKRAALSVAMPFILTAALVAAVAVYILFQPMQMRGGIGG